MNHKNIIRQMINFNQTLFGNTFEATKLFQDQVEKIGAAAMEQAGGMSGEGRVMYDNCMEACKSARSNFKTYVDEGYQQAENFFK